MIALILGIICVVIGLLLAGIGLLFLLGKILGMKTPIWMNVLFFLFGKASRN